MILQGKRVGVYFEKAQDTLNQMSVVPDALKPAVEKVKKVIRATFHMARRVKQVYGII